jgi:serine/threonine protein kinase
MGDAAMTALDASADTASTLATSSIEAHVQRAFSSGSMDSVSPLIRMPSVRHFSASPPIRSPKSGGLMDRLRHASSNYYGIRPTAMAVRSPFPSHKGEVRHAVKLRRGSHANASHAERIASHKTPNPLDAGLYLVLADAAELQMEVWKVFSLSGTRSLSGEDDTAFQASSTEGEACREIARLVERHGQPESLCPILEIVAHPLSGAPFAVRMPYFLGGNLAEWLQSAAHMLVNHDSGRHVRPQDVSQVGEFSIPESAAVQLVKQILVALTFLHNPDDARVCLKQLNLKNIFVEQIRANGLPADFIEYYTLVCTAQNLCQHNGAHFRSDASAPVVSLSYNPHMHLNIPYLRLRIGQFCMNGEPIKTTDEWTWAPELRPKHAGTVTQVTSGTRDSAEMWSTGLILAQLLGFWFHGELESLCTDLGSRSIGTPAAIKDRLPLHIESKCLIGLLSDMLQFNPFERPTSVDALTRLAKAEETSVDWDASFFSRYQFVSGMGKLRGASGLSYFPWNSTVPFSTGASTQGSQPSQMGKVSLYDLHYVEEPVNPAERFRRLMMKLPHAPEAPERRMLRVYTIFDMPATIQGLQRSALSHMLRISQRLCEGLVKYAVPAAERFDELLTAGAGNISYTTMVNHPISLTGWLLTLRPSEDPRLLSNPTIDERIVRYICLNAISVCDKLWRVNDTTAKGHGSIMPHTLMLQHEPQKFLSVMTKRTKSIATSLPWFESSHFTLDIPLEEMENDHQSILQTHDIGYYYVHSVLSSYKQCDNWSVDVWLRDVCLTYLSPTRLRAILDASKFAELKADVPDAWMLPCLAADFLVADMFRQKEPFTAPWTAQVTQFVADAKEFGILALTEVLHQLFKRYAEASAPSRMPIVEIINSLCACVITDSARVGLDWRQVVEARSPRYEGATILHSAAASLCVEFFKQHAEHLLPVDILARMYDEDSNTIFHLFHDSCVAAGTAVSEAVTQFYDCIGRHHPDIARVFQTLKPWELRRISIFELQQLKPAVDGLLDYSCANELLFCMVCSDAFAEIERRYRNIIADSREEDSSTIRSNPLSQIRGFMAEILARFIQISDASTPESKCEDVLLADLFTPSLPNVPFVWTPHQFTKTELDTSLARLDAVRALIRQHVLEDAASYIHEACITFCTLPGNPALFLSACSLSTSGCDEQSAQMNQRQIDMMATNVSIARAQSDAHGMSGPSTISGLQSIILQHMEATFHLPAVGRIASGTADGLGVVVEELIKRLMASTSTMDDRYALGMSLATLLLGPRIVEGPPGCSIVSDFVRAVWSGALKHNPTDYLPPSRVSEGARNVIVKLLYEYYSTWESALSDIGKTWVATSDRRKRRLVFQTVANPPKHTGLHVLKAPSSLLRIPKDAGYTFTDVCTAALHRLFHPEDRHVHNWKLETDMQLLLWHIQRIVLVFDEITLENPDEAAILLTRLLRMHKFGGESTRGYAQRIHVVVVGFDTLKDKTGFVHTNTAEHLLELGFDRHVAKADMSA